MVYLKRKTNTFTTVYQESLRTSGSILPFLKCSTFINDWGKITCRIAQWVFPPVCCVFIILHSKHPAIFVSFYQRGKKSLENPGYYKKAVVEDRFTSQMVQQVLIVEGSQTKDGKIGYLKGPPTFRWGVEFSKNHNYLHNRDVNSTKGNSSFKGPSSSPNTTFPRHHSPNSMNFQIQSWHPYTINGFQDVP